MRTFKPTFAFATLGTTLLAASCTLITDVDRTKIPTDSGAGTAGTGGSSAGSSSGSSGDAGESSGGAPEAGAGGTSNGGSGSSGDAGEGGTGTSGSSNVGGEAGSGGSSSVTPMCAKAGGSLSLAPGTFLSDGETLILRDGVNRIEFEFDCFASSICTGLNGAAPTDGVEDGNVAIAFDGTEDQVGLATKIRDAINLAQQNGDITITAVFDDGGTDPGAAGASGEGAGGAGGEAGAIGGAPSGGTGGSGGQPTTAVITLTNDRYGSLGNQKIDDGVGNGNFSNQDMKGGVAVSCDQRPTLCDEDADCDSSCDVDVNLCE